VNNATIQASGASIIQEAESWIYRRLRHWKMIPVPATGNIASGNDFLTLPTDFLEPRRLFITGTNFAELRMTTDREVIQNWTYDGSGARVQQQPMIYYFDQAAFRFDSVADQAYPYALVYYQQPAALGASNATNFLTSTYPRLMRCALMAAACEWLKDMGQGQINRTYWDELAMIELQAAQIEGDRAIHAIEFGAIIA